MAGASVQVFVVPFVQMHLQSSCFSCDLTVMKRATVSQSTTNNSLTLNPITRRRVSRKSQSKGLLLVPLNQEPLTNCQKLLKVRNKLIQGFVRVNPKQMINPAMKLGEKNPPKRQSVERKRKVVLIFPNKRRNQRKGAWKMVNQTGRVLLRARIRP